MSEITPDDLRELARRDGFPRLTVHTPMERAGREVEKNRIYLKNAARLAEEKLTAHGMQAGAAETFVAPIRDLGNDNERMQNQLGGMSLFVDENETRIVELAYRLPERVELGDRYCVVPLLRPALENRDYAILTLSQGGAGLYLASRYAARIVELEDLPEDLCYVLRYDQFEKSVQLHTSSAGGEAAIHHGHGAGKDEHDRFIRRFIDAVEPVVSGRLAKRNLPLVLIGAEESLGHYRKRTQYEHLVENQKVVDPHTLSLDDLIRLGWECMGPRLDAERQAEIDRLRAHENTVRGIQAVLPAVAEGRAETLFIDPDRTLRGSFDLQHEDVVLVSRPEDGEQDLLNLAAVNALAYGTRIVLVSEELSAPAAILR